MKWEKVKLGDLAICIQPGPFGSQLHSSDYADEGTPIIMPKDMIDGKISQKDLIRVPDKHLQRLKRHQVFDGDLMVARKGDVRKCVYITKNENGWLTGSDCLKVSLDKEKCFPKYIYYQLRSPFMGRWLETISIGATMPSLNTGLLSGIEIFLPTIEEQKRIAGILSAYDSLIENNQEQIKLLEEAAQRLYKEWFVDLRFPDYETTPIVDGIPQGWENASVTDLLEIRYGKDHKGLADGCIPVYGSGGIMRKVDKILYSGESVLIPRKGSLNNILLVSGDFWTIDTMFYSVPKRPNVAKYVYLYLTGIDMYAMNIGAAVPSMTVKILDGMRLLCPSDSILELFETTAKPYYEMIELLKRKQSMLGETRDRLLPKLMSGEIEV